MSIQYITQAIQIVPQDDETKPFKFIAVSSNKNRNRLQVIPQGIRTDAFRQNPVILWNYESGEMPIGKVMDLRVEGSNLVAEIIFADKSVNPNGPRVKKAFEQGYLNAVSIGYIPKKTKKLDQNYLLIEEAELVEISVVPVPADANALMVRQDVDDDSVSHEDDKYKYPLSLAKARLKLIAMKGFE